MKYKIITGILLAAVCLFTLFGCADQPVETQPHGEAEKIASAVVIGDSEKPYVRAIAGRVNALIDAEDRIYTIENAPESSMRIVIGTTQEFELGALALEVPFGGYLIRMHEGDLYILAHQDMYLEDAAMKVLREVNHWYGNKAIVIADDYRYIPMESGALFPSDIPEFDGATFHSAHNYDNGHQVITLKDVTRDEFDAYCAKLEANKFTLFAENEINDNPFMTYRNDDELMLHTYWIAHSQEVRTVIAHTDLLPITDSPDVAQVSAPLLHQLAGGDEMGYIIRLADGRFIIVDGGNPTVENAEEIFTFLKKHAPDADRVVIAAWFVTHAHTDHCGALIEFAKKYASDSTIALQSVMFNPCETAEQMQYCNATRRAALDNALSTYYSDVPVYKPLTGQVYTFGKTTIEILYTMSDFMPNVIAYEPDGKGGDYNVMSTVCMIDIDSSADLQDRWFVMGDTTTVACNEMSARYGTALKCDFVQVSHHGYSPLPVGLNCRRHGATIEIYDLIDPTIALWPAAADKIPERSILEINAHLISIVDQIAVAGDGEATFVFE